MSLTHNRDFRKGTKVVIESDTLTALMVIARERDIYQNRREAEQDGYREIVTKLIEDATDDT